MNGHWAYWFFEETYRENIYLIWYVNDAQRMQFIKSHFGLDVPPADRAWAGRACEILPNDDGSGDGGHVISLKNSGKRSQIIGVIAHEAFHVVSNILTTRHVPFGNSMGDENEAYTYLLERIVRTCYQAMDMEMTV